ncbi:DUF302 domain-containing protein [Halovulum sp. GXIMD14794]
MLRHLIPAALALFASAAHAADLTPREGWEVRPTGKTHAELVEATRAAIGESPLAVVTQAGPTGAAASRGIEIPGNLVIGAFNNDFAVKILNLSTAAMIEAPVRFYVTENADGSATLSHKKPSFVFAPYLDEGGEELEALAAELDALFAGIVEAATAE